MLVNGGVSHSQRRAQWFGCGPSTAFLANQAPVYCGCPANGVTSSPGRDEIKAPTLLVCGMVEVFVGSRGELERSGVFLYTSVELQHPSSSKRVTSVGRLQRHLALERPHQFSSNAATTVHHDSYSPLATPFVRSSDTISSFHRGQNDCNWDIALFACSCP